MKWGYNETLSLKVSGYSSWIQDEILYQDEFYKNNNFNTKHQGWAIQLRSKPIENLDLRFSYNKDFGELLSSSPTGSTMKVGNQIANIPEYVAMLSATYTASRQLGITLLGRMQGSSTPINDFSGVAKRVDAFTVWDVIATYQFGTVNLYGKVENLFDKLYPAYSAYGVNSSNQTYYPGNRQTVSVGVKVDF
jgi:outer membrane cobalamin receptor